MNFSGQVAIVTGAGDGLGRAHALWLAKHGASVVVNNRRQPDMPSSAQTVAAEITALGGRAIADDHAVDEPDAGKAMVKAALDGFGRIDIVLCNAGITILEPFDQLDLQNFRKVVDVNLWGTVNAVHAAWPTMVKQRYGRIVLTTSTGGLYGVPNSTPYSTSKASLIGFARALTFDVPEGSDIKINVLAPSAATKMLKGWVSDEMAAVLSPERVATTAGWLASKECDRSGIILFAAAGRVTRVRIVESEPVEIVDDDFHVDWSTLDSTEHVTEASGVFESLAKLLPKSSGPAA
ncbi:MAG: SDR family NAD(P)-dependent oxidoreductase [Steroidobacteraceae bacterium]